MTADKKPKGKRRSRKTPVAGTPEASPPIAAERTAAEAADPSGASAGPEPPAEVPEPELPAEIPEPSAESRQPGPSAASREPAPEPRAEHHEASIIINPSAPEAALAEAGSLARVPVTVEASATGTSIPDALPIESSLPVVLLSDASEGEPVHPEEPDEPDEPDESVESVESVGPVEPDKPARPEADRRLEVRRATDRRAGAKATPVAIDDDGWPLESADGAALAAEAGAAEAGTGAAGASSPGLPAAGAPAPAPVVTAAQLPSPAAAAYEAARIVGEMVGDIASAPGAALVAAAAAGAAIEVTRARAAAGEPERSLPPGMTAAEAASGDPAVTVRMQRDRVLRALAEDIAASAGAAAASAGAAAASAGAAAASGGSAAAAGTTTARDGRAPSHPGRATTQPGRDELEDFDDGLDPVAIAAAAISRLRNRARSDLAELRVHYQRHDIVVLVIAFVIIVVAGRIHAGLVTPPLVPFEPGADHGLVFDHPRGWLVSAAEPLPAPRIVREVAPPSAKPVGGPYRVELISTADPMARIEVVIDKKPGWSNIVTGLDLDRRTRWGELYTLDDSSVRSVEDHQWLRTAYRFAHVLDKGDVPRIDRAVEYATIDREQIYVITLFGSSAEIDQIEETVVPTLRVASQTGLPLVPQTGHLSARKYPNAVSRAFDTTVMVVVADIVDGRLRARGGGSGVIVGKDGSILTNYHVIHDRNGRLHDAFVIGRFSEQDKAPQLHCAGKPSRSKLQRELDLALIKCDLDLDGRNWSPARAGQTWPTLPQARSADIKMGQRIWVLGYPDVGGGGLTLSEGEVEGWSGVDGAVGKDFIKTDAAIRHGNSGGPVVGDDGKLVGIASAVRTKLSSTGDVIEVVQAGGRVRPIASASDLLAIAAAGWTPREGQTDVELQPSAIEVPSEGVQIQSRVLDAANEAPVRDALVMVLRPGVNASTVDVNRLDDQVLAYGRSTAQGEVVLKQPVPVPGTYTLMVVARGYEPMIGEGELTLEADTPAVYDPWGKLLLRAR